jgi:hypothetical protein
MKYLKIKHYTLLFLSIISFVFGTFFVFSEPELLKASGGGYGLIFSVLSVLVIFIQPIFGKLSGIIIFYPIGCFFAYCFIKSLRLSKLNA